VAQNKFYAKKIIALFENLETFYQEERSEGGQEGKKPESVQAGLTK